MIAATELAPEEVVVPEDAEIHHWFCEDAPRNNPVVTVMCCGTPFSKSGKDRDYLPGDIECPICYHLYDVPLGIEPCACWQVAIG